MSDDADTIRLRKWATDDYRHERDKFPFGVYANPFELKADILAHLAALGRVVAEVDELREYATKVEGERDGWIAQVDELRARLQQHEQTDLKEEANG